MSSRPFRSLLAAACLAVAALLLVSCQAARQPDAMPRDWQPKRIGVLPFQLGVTDASGGAVRSPLTGAAFVPGPVQEGAALFLDEALDRSLPDITALEVVPVEVAGRLFDRLRHEDISLPLRQAAMQAGQQVGVDGVLIGFVYRFSERVGETFAADRPASAAFDLALIRVSDGAVLWKNSFDDTQRAVSEDLIEASQYLNRGVRWFSVREWGDYGLEQLLKRFPWRKEIKDAKDSKEG
jgi:hypothetical protein